MIVSWLFPLLTGEQRVPVMGGGPVDHKIGYRQGELLCYENQEGILQLESSQTTSTEVKKTGEDKSSR